MAKKAFKRLRIATPLSLLRSGIFRGNAAVGRCEKLTVLLLLCAWFGACPQRPTRKSIASRWLAVALAINRVGFMVQRFRRMT